MNGDQARHGRKELEELTITGAEGEPDPRFYETVNDIPWFAKVVEGAETYLATVPDDQKSTWFLELMAERTQAEQARHSPAATAEAERDALAAKLAAIAVACQKMARGVGYRVSGDHETWSSWHEGKSDFAGEVEDIIDADPAEFLAKVRDAAVADAAQRLENSPFSEHLLQRHQKGAAAQWMREHAVQGQTGP